MTEKFINKNLGIQKGSPNFTESSAILTEEQNQFRTNMLSLFKRELTFLKHRGIRSAELKKLNIDEVNKLKNIFENCIEKVDFIEDDDGKVLGWKLKNESFNCDE